MLQFRVYLQSELGKFRQAAESSSFLRSTSRDLLFELRLPNSPEAITELLGDQSLIEKYVDALTEPELRILAGECSRWRRNDVALKLDSAKSWSIDSVPIAKVDVQQAEPHLGEFFRRRGFALTRVAGDPALFTYSPYSGWSKATRIVFPVCLAIRRGVRYRLFDGIHRAIQSAWSGADALTVCWAERTATRGRL